MISPYKREQKQCSGRNLKEFPPAEKKIREEAEVEKVSFSGQTKSNAPLGSALLLLQTGRGRKTRLWEILKRDGQAINPSQLKA